MGLPFNMQFDAREEIDDKMECLQSLPTASSESASKNCRLQKAKQGIEIIEDEVFEAASTVCNPVISKKQLDVDFAELEKRKLSTSTPSGTRTLSGSAIYTQAASDSGFNESTWSTDFSESCCIISHTASTTSNASLYDNEPSIIERDEDITMAMPMPRMYLKFSDQDDPMEGNSQDADSAFGDCSSVHSQSQHSDSCFSDINQSLEPVLEFQELDRLAPLPSPYIVGHRTPAQTSKICSSTPLQDSVSVVVSRIVKEFSPAVPSRLIGRNMGLETMDIVSELSFLDLNQPLSLIMNHLDDEDICRMCCVSRQWNSVCKTNLTAQQKKDDLTSRRQALAAKLQKENIRSVRGCRKKVTGGGDTPLSVVQDLVEAPIRKSLPTPTSHQQFVQEANRLRCDESLRKCPACQKPARVHEVQERAQCTNRKCGLDFCIKCNNAFHGSRECRIASGTNKKSRIDSTVGTKKSKKNLKRL